MNKVISYTLWGNNPKYTVGAIENARLREKIYPDWTSVFFIGQDVSYETIKILSGIDSTKIINMKVNGNWAGMFWRFLPSLDEAIDIMVSRDTDSRISIREKMAVDEWLLSDKDFHIMRDHPFHNTAILGGMWGSRNGILKKIGINFDIDSQGDYWQVDQDFLRSIVYPKIINNCISHDPYNHMNEFFRKEFPTARINQEFVGEIYDEYNNRHPDHYTLL